MVTGVGAHGRGKQLVLLDHLLQRRDPVVVVLPITALGVRGVLPTSDRLDQALLEIGPLVVAELGKGDRKPESPSLPFVFELRRGSIGGACLMQRAHGRGPASATPIIDSVVTRSISISSVKSAVPAGRSGMTNQRLWPLLSSTLISVLSGRSRPTSRSTARGSRAARARNTGSLYQ